jgi:hypothetical protein
MTTPAAEASNEKYKIFRNFMTNELGITRDDIEAWTKEAVSTQVRKLVGQINIEKEVKTSIDTSVRQAIFTSSYRNTLTHEAERMVRQAIASELAGRIKFTNPDG